MRTILLLLHKLRPLLSTASLIKLVFVLLLLLLLNRVEKWRAHACITCERVAQGSGEITPKAALSEKALLLSRKRWRLDIGHLAHGRNRLCVLESQW